MTEDLVMRVENLHVTFDTKSVLKGINLNIKQGEELCIVGKSGAGKTVLVNHLRAAEDFLYPNKGRVLFYNQNLAELSEKKLNQIRKQIGFVFQKNALFDSLDVFSNVASGIKAHPYTTKGNDNPEIQQIVRQNIEAVGLAWSESSYQDLIKTKARQLSGGMAKRVAIARTIAMNPPIIIYDEPTSGLDPETSGLINNLISELYEKNNKTTIVISHDITTMKKISDRIVFLNSGKIHFDSSYQNFIKSDKQSVINFLAEQRPAL